MAVTLRIEEVVLHGFDPRDRHAIAEALREELGRLFAEGTFASFAAPHIDAGEVRAESVRTADAPRAIAAAIHREVVR